MIKNFLEYWRDWKRNRRMTVKCDKCGEDFNTEKQAGLCPHISIKEFIYGYDPAAPGGDHSVKVWMRQDKDGKITVLKTEILDKGEIEDVKNRESE